MESNNGCVCASLDKMIWTAMGSNISHVEAARQYALQELTPHHDPQPWSVFTKWVDGDTIFRHEVRVGISCEVTPIREDED